MYKNGVLCVIKDDKGKILREYDGNTVYIPFSEEYSLSFKNLESRKAVISIKIDGVDILDLHKLILYPDIETKVERFMLDGDFNKGNKFKFIEKTHEISEFRDRIDDGLIEIKFQFEKEQPVSYGIAGYRIITNSPEWHWNEYNYSDNTFDGSTVRGMTDGGRNLSDSPRCADNTKCCSSNAYYASSTIEQPNDGITVKGSVSNQSFSYGYTRGLEFTVHTMVIKLKGKTNQAEISKPIYLKTNIQCSTCGRKYKTNFKFCPNCGTCLI
jgi:hypothetical protein